MTLRILLLSDIHGNYPALKAIDQQLQADSFNYIINCGDSLVYAPFPNETLDWLASHKAISILGNTDKKVIKLLKGKSFKKPGNAEKRIMYRVTAETLDKPGRRYLLSLPKATTLPLSTAKRKGKKNRSDTVKLALYHGSPAHHHEFLFATTPDSRFRELATIAGGQIVVTGHSHTPYHKKVSQVHFINPGSVGRMFDGDPRASCAVLTLSPTGIEVQHHRIAYEIEDVISQLRKDRLPDIYDRMFRCGKKLN